MKTLKEQLTNESRSLNEYTIALNDGNGTVVTLVLNDLPDAKYVDKWLENELGNSIAHYEGGPHHISD